MARDDLASLLKAFDVLPKAARASIKPALEKGAEELVDRMRYLAPVGKARKAANDNYRGIEKRTDTMVGRVNGKMASIGKNFAAGLLGGIAAGGIAGIVSRLSEVAKGVAAIGDEAKRAGVSLRAFQEWKFVAEQNRIGIDQMTDGLKELNLAEILVEHKEIEGPLAYAIIKQHIPIKWPDRRLTGETA